METKKIYIAPSIEVVTVLHESPLLDFSTEGSNTVGDKETDYPGTEPFAKQHNNFSLWEEEETYDNKGLWD